MAEDQPDKRDDYPNLSDLITLKQAAEISGLSYSHMRLLARKEKIRAIRLGHEWFTTAKDVDDYLAQGPRPGPKRQKGPISTDQKG